MAIITSVPAIGSIVKGSPATFTLSKAQLLLVPSVAASTYYSDSSNWKSVILFYQSSPLAQPEIVYFDASQVTPTGTFDVVLSALDVFNIQSISIVDFQGGVFTVPRSELNVSEFDVDMSTPPALLDRNFLSPNSLLGNESINGQSSFTAGGLHFGSNYDYPLYTNDTGVPAVIGQVYNIKIVIGNIYGIAGANSWWAFYYGTTVTNAVIIPLDTIVGNQTLDFNMTMADITSSIFTISRLGNPTPVFWDIQSIEINPV